MSRKKKLFQDTLFRRCTSRSCLTVTKFPTVIKIRRFRLLCVAIRTTVGISQDPPEWMFVVGSDPSSTSYCTCSRSLSVGCGQPWCQVQFSASLPQQIGQKIPRIYWLDQGIENWIQNLVDPSRLYQLGQDICCVSWTFHVELRKRRANRLLKNPTPDRLDLHV